MRTLIRYSLAGLMIMGLAGVATAGNKEFTNWPAGMSPEEIGRKIVKDMLPRWIPRGPGVHYAEDSTWYSALEFAKLIKDQAMTDALVKRYDPWRTEEGQKKLVSWQHHVDHNIFGIVPLELYIRTKDPQYLALGKKLADQQWEDPRPDGLSAETRFWVDDTYMITILQLQAYRAMGDKVYLDRAALEMVAYLDKLQRPNGLFYHGPDIPFFWGRGNGWVAGGMSELLTDLPKNHPQRARIMQGYLKMMASLLKYQDADGVWHQLIDHPESYQESSSTAMFTYAMITGVKKGWLKDKAYAQAARKGWIGLNKLFIDKDGLVDKVCVGTGQTNSLEFYLNRPTQKGNPHGQAPVLWCINALLRK
ncbi:MAG: glycoside hydrolase family 88 protein [Bryobacteraceae bacterium]